MTPWEHVIKIPEQAIGEYAIKHLHYKAGPIARSNMRTAIIGGQSESPLEFDRPTQWHELVYEGGTWMTDLPIEQQQHDNELEPMTEGDILVGGLGLGYAATILAARPDVNRVTVVEISPEVIALVQPYLKDPDGKIEVVQADLLDYLDRDALDTMYDWCFYDIWQRDGVTTFLDTVIPLRRMSCENGWASDDENVICWNENVMRGQLAFSLHSSWAAVLMGRGTAEELAQERDDKYWDWMVPFWQGVLQNAVTEDNYQDMIGSYAGTYGRPFFHLWWHAFLTGRWTLEEAYR
jgi:hypothetical protein